MVLRQNLDAARSGDARAALIELRDTLAAAMDDARPDMLPQLAGQYRSVLKDLAGLPDHGVVNKADELKARRASRVAKAKTSASAKKPGRERGA